LQAGNSRATGWTIGVLGFDFRQRWGMFSLHHQVQNGSGTHPASYPMGTRGSFPGSKASEGWSWPFTFIYCRGQERVELYLHSPSTSPWRCGSL